MTKATGETLAFLQAAGHKGQAGLMDRFRAEIEADPAYGDLTPEQRETVARISRRLWLRSIGKTGGRPRKIVPAAQEQVVAPATPEDR